MLKVSISLPGETVITFEASEPHLFREVIGLALKELPRDLMLIQLGGTSSPGPDASATSRKNVVPAPPEHRVEDGQGGGPTFYNPSEDASHMGDGEESYAKFCDTLSPLGDMRRVVVAAEGAMRFLGIDKVSETELGRLFHLAGWRRPGTFLQTLRNAARSKFRWLERVPGAPGYYTVSETGRHKIIGPGE